MARLRLGLGLRLAPASPLLVSLLALAAAALPPPSAALDFRGMEENCILSFVVPRDKVKSSCDVEQRVTRRLNAMEAKVTLYKQHVQELQEQLAKERQFHSQRLEELHQRLSRSELSEVDGLLEKRIQALEAEVRKIRATVSSSSSSSASASARDSQSPSLGEKVNSRGVGVGVGAGLVVDRSREEEEKATTNLVKTLVHSEVRKLFDNYTQYVGRYVRDQALAFNQILNMVPRNDQSFPGSDNLPPQWPASSKGAERERGSTPPTPLPERDLVLLNELEGIRSRLNTTGRRLADHVQEVLKNVNVTARPSKAPDTAAAAATTAAAVSELTESTSAAHTRPDTASSSGVQDLELEGSSGLPVEVNDTASGSDTNDTSSGDHNITLTFTHLGDGNDTAPDSPMKNVYVTTGAADDDSAPPSSSAAKDKDMAAAAAAAAAAAEAKSRMSHNADLNKLPDTPPAGTSPGSGGDDVDKATRQSRSGSESEAGGNQSRGWEESMVHDQGAGEWVQLLLRTEIQKILQEQVNEVLSLVSKHSAMVDTKLHDQQSQFHRLEERLTADIKHLDQMVSGLKLELSSVSQGLQTLYSRTEQTEELQETVAELKKNMSMEGNSRLLATLLDEHGKKVRKIERLTDIYKQSLEHYRNETKLEYRDLKERLAKEGTVLRAMHTDLFLNVTHAARQLHHRLNASATKSIDDVRQRVQVMEDNSLLLQIDLSSLERQLKSKTSKSERDVNKLTEDVGDLKQKTRGLQKSLNSALAEQERLAQVANATSSRVQQLQMEVKLNVLDDWLPYNFEYMKTRTDCFGEQYVRKSGFKTGRLVGVVLCSRNRYKIFLGQSLTDTFKNIGDDSGMGEDHCQFVNARSMSKVKVSSFRTSTETEPGYVRTHWGQEPRPELLNIIRPSPAWYECGVSIP